VTSYVRTCGISAETALMVLVRVPPPPLGKGGTHAAG
jgi:hypothetical protein